MGRRYAHAPIAQAILEFQVVTPPELDLDDLADLDFGHAYNDARALYHLQGQLIFGEGADSPSRAEGDHVGYGFSRDDGARLIQAGRRRFSFIWRGDYTDWTDFSKEAEAAWMAYQEVARVETVVDVGVRFVNHIALPNRAIEIKDYLRASVDIPAHLPQAVSSLFFQVEIPMEKLDVHATITSGILSDSEDDAHALLLDIDVKTHAMHDTGDAEFDSQVRATLDKLRLAKNFIFEACITDATRGMIS